MIFLGVSCSLCALLPKLFFSFRALGTLKKYVKNNARPEGSIAEGYIVNEALTYCSMYLSRIETRFNCPDRNSNFDEMRGTSTLSIFNQPTRPYGKKASFLLDENEYCAVHWYILNNCSEIQSYIE